MLNVPKEAADSRPASNEITLDSDSPWSISILRRCCLCLDHIGWWRYEGSKFEMFPYDSKSKLTWNKCIEVAHVIIDSDAADTIIMAKIC